jgi:phospholipid/cholesterol/gamma-HCH transport system permease protein
MTVTEQIDALKTMGINPVRYLAMPRFFASIFMMPALVMIANVIAVIGAYIISDFFLGISSTVFFESVKRFFFIGDLIFGMLKGVIFGGVTALIGCHIGFSTTGGAEGVGQSTIRSFVLNAALILVFDYLLWTIVF